MTIDPLLNDTLAVSAVNGQSTNVGHALAGAYGTLTLNADGSYNYAAAHNEHKLPESGVGLDTFTYTAKDGAGVTATTTLTIVVTEEDKTYLGGIPQAPQSWVQKGTMRSLMAALATMSLSPERAQLS